MYPSQQSNAPANSSLAVRPQLIHVLVGNPTAPSEPRSYFRFYASQLAPRSRWFNQILQQPQGWVVGIAPSGNDDGNRIVWVEEKISTVELYAMMVLEGEIGIKEENNDDVPPKTRSELISAVNIRYLQLFELFLLCERLEDVRGKNQVIRDVVRQLRIPYVVSGSDGHVLPAPHNVNFIYMNTSSASMRRLMVDMWAYRSFDHILAIADRNFEHKFLADVVLRCLRLEPTVPDGGWGPEDIHSAPYYES